MCTLPDGASVSFRVNDEEGGQAHGARVFAGLRMDPNFADTKGYVETVATRRLAFRAKGVNQTADANILSIVVELDVATVLGSTPGKLFAVVAETNPHGEWLTPEEAAAQILPQILSNEPTIITHGDSRTAFR